jgi:hypothetical protein
MSWTKSTVPPRAPWRGLSWSVQRTLATLFQSAPVAVTVTCRNCGRVNAAGEIYCQGCTRTLAAKRPCPHCGHGSPANARYCPKCGKHL